MSPELERASRFLVDGNNVMGARADGWWRDRRAAAARLVADLAPLAATAEVTVVFDGPPPDDDASTSDPAPVDVRYAARGGRDAADDVIAALVAADDDPGGLVVVTADRDLRARVVAAGARVAGPTALLDRLDNR